MKGLKRFTLAIIVSLALLASAIPAQAQSWGKTVIGFGGTSGTILNLGDSVCFSGTTLYPADANDSDKQPAVGFVERAVGAGTITGVVIQGTLNGQTGLTAGSTAYLSDTAGSIVQTAVSAYPQVLGFASSATTWELDIHPYSAAAGAVTATTGTFSGDITADGGFHMLVEFADDNIASAQAAQALTTGGSSTVTEFEAPWSGSITAISINTNESRTQGSLIVDVTVNGTVTGLQATLDNSNADHHSATQVKDTDTFSAEDRIGVKYTTNAEPSSWLPVTADIGVWVTIESGGDD